MTLAKFQPNRTTGSKVMAKNLKKKALFWNWVPGTNYPVPGYPDFANYPVLITRFLTTLFEIQKTCFHLNLMGALFDPFYDHN